MAPLRLLFVHGFMGTPTQFDALRELLQARGMEGEALTLPGHDADLQAFCASNAAQWQKAVDETVLDASKDGKKVLLVTHSMGGLLAVHTAIKYPDRIAGIVAIGLPLALRVTARFVRYRLAALFPARGNESEEVCAIRKFCGVFGITIGNSIRLIPNTIALLRLIRTTRTALPSLPIPLTVLNAKRDEIVAKKSLGLAKRLCPHAVCVPLHEGSHFWYPMGELQTMADVICNLCKEA